MKFKTGLLISMFSLGLLTGCGSTGVINGAVDGQHVAFNYEQGFAENSGTLTATMPDGEFFSGKFVQASQSKSGSDLVIGESSDDDSLIFKDSTITSSATKAILNGNRGNSMDCELQFADPDYGIDGGGIGKCKVSDGRVITMTF